MSPDYSKKTIKYTAFYNTGLSVLIFNHLVLTKPYLSLQLKTPILIPPFIINPTKV
jgi:hypothetical protein